MFEQVQLFKVKSVVDPIFKMAISILAMSIFSIAIRPHTWMPVALFVLACVFFAFGIICYGYFMAKDPTFLRSEEHELKKKALEMLNEKGKDYTTNDLLLLTNPFSEADLKMSSEKVTKLVE